jgi:hypothetical protein
MEKLMRPIAAGLAVLVLLAGCEYTKPVDNAVVRNLEWFSYLGGEDIRKSCGPGAQDRFRFVYNGIYTSQIRSYDVAVAPGGGADVSAFARSDPDLSRAIDITRIFSLWDGERANSIMVAREVAALRQALAKDRFLTDRPVGLRLPSNEFYWTAVACVDGGFHANAWLYPSDRYRTLNFPEVLLAHDRTGVGFYGARPTDQRDDDPTHYTGKYGSDPFFLELGENGFAGTDALL